MKTYYFEVEGVKYETKEGSTSCKGCAFEFTGVYCNASVDAKHCWPNLHWIKSPNQPSRQPKQKQNMPQYNQSIKAPYPQVYVIMDKTDNSKSWQFKGPRVYIKYEEAKERCDGMNRYAKGKPNIVVGFELENGCEVSYEGMN